MNKTIIALALTSVIGSTAAVAAGNAILDVEGEIRINGQTVIDNTGKFIGLEFAQDNQVTVSDYYAQNGTYTYLNENCDFYSSGCKEIWSISDNTETYTFYIREGEGEWIKDSESTWQDNGDGTYTYTYVYGEGDSQQSGSSTYSSKDLTSNSDTYLIGTLLTKAYEETLISSSSEYDVVGSTYVGTISYLYGAKIAEYQIEDGTTFKNCLVGDYSNIACENVGDVTFNGDWKLVSFEPSANAQASSQSAASTRIDPRIIRQKLASFKNDKS